MAFAKLYDSAATWKKTVKEHQEEKKRNPVVEAWRKPQPKVKTSTRNPREEDRDAKEHRAVEKDEAGNLAKVHKASAESARTPLVAPILEHA